MARAYVKGLIGIGLIGILAMAFPGQVWAGIDDGLVGYWSFSGNGNDNTGNGHDGAVLGPTLAPDAYGNANSAYSFGGGGFTDHLRVADDPALNLHTDFSISFWVNQEDTGWISSVLGKGADVLNTYYFARFEGSNVIDFITRPNDLGPVDAIGVAVPFGEWHHVTGVYAETAGKMRLYLDGVLAAEKDIEQAPFVTTNNFPLVIGGLYTDAAGADGMTYPFKGKLDEVRIYDRALNPAEVVSVYSTIPLVVSTPDTTASYNQLVTVPVRASNTTGAGIVAGEVSLAFNGDLLSVSSVGTSGTLMSGWTLQTNVVQGNATVMDTLKVAAANSTALSGAGTLFNVQFQVADVRHPAASPLTLSYVLLNTGDVATVEVNGSLKLVGNDGSLSSVPSTIIPRQTIGVTVTDVDENRNSGVAEVRSVQVSNGSQTETLNVTETGVSTGVFTGSIATVFSLAPTSGDGIVQAKAGDEVVFAFADSLDSVGNTAVRRDTTNVIGGKDGHLRVTVVVQPGDTLRVRLADMDLNTNTGTVESTTVSGVNVRTGESELLTLTEKSANDSIFFGIVKTTLGATAGSNNDGVFKAQKGDTLRITYADTLTALGGYATVIDRDKVVNPFGDADGNGSVQAFDAARVLFHVLAPFIVGIDSLSANVDLLAPFGQISPYDASLILQKRVGLIGRFPVQEKQSDNQPQPETGLSKLVVAQRLLSLVQGDGYWSVVADERSGILSGDLVLSGIEGKVELGPELQEYLIASRNGEGGLRVVFAGAVPVSGSGELLRVYPGVGPGSAQLTRAELNDGQLGVVLSGMAAAVKVPTTFALLANYPNPFNPETTIGFALPQRSLVTLAVYNALGQQVRMLVSRELPASQHQVVWDGRDEVGQQVSSGVYMYRLQAGSFSQLKRMIMIK